MDLFPLRVLPNELRFIRAVLAKMQKLAFDIKGLGLTKEFDTLCKAGLLLRLLEGKEAEDIFFFLKNRRDRYLVKGNLYSFLLEKVEKEILYTDTNIKFMSGEDSFDINRSETFFIELRKGISEKDIINLIKRFYKKNFSIETNFNALYLSKEEKIQKIVRFTIFYIGDPVLKVSINDV